MGKEIKFGGLAVGVETAKLKSANITSPATGDDTIHAVVHTLGPRLAPPYASCTYS